MIDKSLKRYIEETILPLYDNFDAAHHKDHADMVIKQSMEISGHLNVNENMVFTIAAYHDTGLASGRSVHHLVSGKIVREDAQLHNWFTSEEIETIAQACEDHRASSDHEPRSIYGRIVAEADRFIDPDTIIRRTVQYGLTNYHELDREGHWRRTIAHLNEKYAKGGYLRLWLANSPNEKRLNMLREIIKDERLLQEKFNAIYNTLINDSSCPQCQPPKNK